MKPSRVVGAWAILSHVPNLSAKQLAMDLNTTAKYAADLRHFFSKAEGSLWAMRRLMANRGRKNKFTLGAC
ncbi:MAG TPA: hypothetical protein ENH62_14015 [Marinobacter sp.]|uniref:Uncharacterized protein n=1 Tax=marine sediment metagenome TaxID=412755 RepID=A0A0F9M847_9ZZZZ|nr:hypothetical protein [Marinobacter sp.]|tara:strand:- start:5167 stop:5379 length:213 start_codon:yes stop_codon:yes gene_type:complete